MKTTSTIINKGIFIILLCLTFSAVSANNNPAFSGIELKAAVVNNNLIVDWQFNADSKFNYSEVQASTDGKNFITIGFVTGAEPKDGSTHFIFKQQFSKVKAGKVYYRVVNVANDGTIAATYAVKLNK